MSIPKKKGDKCSIEAPAASESVISVPGGGSIAGAGAPAEWSAVNYELTWKMLHSRTDDEPISCRAFSAAVSDCSRMATEVDNKSDLAVQRPDYPTETSASPTLTTLISTLPPLGPSDEHALQIECATDLTTLPALLNGPQRWLYFERLN